ncbi:MAG: Mut7-C RNAse domain-containing protein [Methanobacteriota archaeon]
MDGNGGNERTGHPPSPVPPSPSAPSSPFPSSPSSPTSPRFVCDEMLGKLARWLRLLGYDAVYMKGVEDPAVLDVAVREARILVTRDRWLAAAAGRKARAVLVEETDPDLQLVRVVRALGLRPAEDRILSRCSEDNTELVAVDAAAAAAPHVPAPVAEKHREFWRCPACGRHYWKGTHVASILDTVRKLREPQRL